MRGGAPGDSRVPEPALFPAWPDAGTLTLAYIVPVLDAYVVNKGSLLLKWTRRCLSPLCHASGELGRVRVRVTYGGSSGFFFSDPVFVWGDMRCLVKL